MLIRYPVHTHTRVYLLLLGLFSMWAAMIVIVAINTPTLVKLFAVATVIFPLLLYLSGNPRLFFLYGLVMTAPLGLSLNLKLLIHIGGASSYSIDLMDFFLVPLLLFLARDFISNKRHRLRFTPIAFFWGGMIILGFFNIVFGPFRHIAGFETFRMIKCLLLFLVIINEVVRLKQFDHIILVIGFFVLMQVMVGFIQYYLKTDLGLQAFGEAAPETIKGANLGVYLSVGAVYRINGLMGHPNLLSAFLALTLPIFISFLFSHRKLYLKLLSGTLVILGIIALILTLSRSGWLSFGIAIISFMIISLLHSEMRKRFIIMRVVASVMIFLVLMAASGPVIKRFKESDSGATSFRLEFNKAAWKMIKARPILGFGLNSSVYHLPGYIKEQSMGALHKRFGKVIPPVHNIYLLTWSEQGSIGFLFFIGLHIAIYKIAYRNLKNYVSDRLYTLNLGCICGLIALLVDGMASFYIRVPACGRTFWIIVAIIAAIDCWNRENAEISNRQGTNRNEVFHVR